MESLSSLVILLLFFGVMYFVLIRPQQKKQKQHQQMVAELTIDDDIVTIGGIHGTIVALAEDTVDIEVTDDTVIRIQRSAIGRVIAPETADVADTDEQTAP